MANSVQPKTPATPAPAAPDPYTDPVGFARSKGYRPLGDPSWPNCRWRHKDVPLTGRETMRPVFAVSHITGMVEAVKASDGRVDRNGKQSEPTEVFQVHFESGAPVLLADIIEHEVEKMEREAQRQAAGGAA
jgi:hypothetical protein